MSSNYPTLAFVPRKEPLKHLNAPNLPFPFEKDPDNPINLGDLISSAALTAAGVSADFLFRGKVVNGRLMSGMLETGKSGRLAGAPPVKAAS